MALIRGIACLRARATPAVGFGSNRLMFSTTGDEFNPVQKAPSDPDADSHDDFKPVLKTPTGSVHESIEKDIRENPVMVYMKGVPQAPQCGFSATVVRILQHHMVPFGARNVLEDPELREGVKTFSKWPTVPQVYIQGEFVGGCDIVSSMHLSGELKEKLKPVKGGSD